MNIQDAFELCHRQLVGRTITDQLIIETINQFSPLMVGIDKDALKEMLLLSFNVTIDMSQTLVDKSNYTPWLEDFKAEHRDWPFWDRYKKYLQVSKHLNDAVVNELDDMTDNTLDKLFNPLTQQGVICKKGLVVGQVQSGKTANYTGLICKAADVGFNFFIVLAGALDDLRSQTQGRIDEGFLGRITDKIKLSQVSDDKIGAGLYSKNGLVAHSYTSSSIRGDFKKTNANNIGFDIRSMEPMILVIKKNASILRNLKEWLESRGRALDSKKLLLIDDEADHYSINTKNSSERTAINEGIRKLLSLFKQKAYVGYTATPFANIFIDANDETDLFPRDFIISLPVPSNYVGPERFFGDNEKVDTDEDEKVIPAVSTIDDYQQYIPDGHKKDDPLPLDIPESMKKAIKMFILNCAIRRVRGQEKAHNSMLIHVSRWKRWHNQITQLVDGEFRSYSNLIKADDPEILKELQCLYEEDVEDISYKSYRTITDLVKGMDIGQGDHAIYHASWENVKRELYPAVVKIKVKAINGDSNENLNYDGGVPVSVIAIGGDKLSRGLTLEGLSVSYFLRASKLYDTLMQMGRWFGYRPGYVDLCRLFLSNEVNEWYRHIAITTKELRDEFKYLYETGGTPEHFALKVRLHPGALKITALGKMRNTQDIRVSWAGHLSETYLLCKDEVTINRNLGAATNLINSLGSNYERINDNYLWRNVNSSSITAFFGNFTLPNEIANFDLPTMIEFIDGLVSKGEYTDWSVAVMSLKSSPNSSYKFKSDVTINLAFRNDSKIATNYYGIRKNHILSSSDDEFIDLDITDLNANYNNANQAFKDRYCQEHPNADRDKVNLAKGRWVREKYRSRQNPLLIIYPLTQKGIGGSDEDKPIIGFAISFPQTNQTDAAVAYKVNATVNTLIQSDDEFDNNNDNEYNDDND